MFHKIQHQRGASGSSVSTGHTVCVSVCVWVLSAVCLMSAPDPCGSWVTVMTTETRMWYFGCKNNRQKYRVLFSIRLNVFSLLSFFLRMCNCVKCHLFSFLCLSVPVRLSEICLTHWPLGLFPSNRLTLSILIPSLFNSFIYLIFHYGCKNACMAS